MPVESMKEMVAVTEFWAAQTNLGMAKMYSKTERLEKEKHHANHEKNEAIKAAADARAQVSKYQCCCVHIATDWRHHRKMQARDSEEKLKEGKLQRRATHSAAPHTRHTRELATERREPPAAPPTRSNATAVQGTEREAWGCWGRPRHVD